MANTGNTQQQINYGAAANDGQGDPLRTAFIKTDDNFDAIWNAGPVGSNITIVNNTLQSNNTNGNIVIRPNGVGVIQANAAIVPNATNLRDLGSADQRFRAAYVGTGGLSVDGNVTVTGNLTAGNISYTGNVFVGDLQGSVYADDSTIMVDAVDNAMFADSATFGEVITTQITNQFPVNITTNGGGAWQFAGNILRGPEGGSWTSAADTIFLNSPANGFITLQSTFLGNTVSELFMEHSFIRFLVDNGGPPVTWQMNLDGSFDMPNYSFPGADGAAGQVLKTYGNGTVYWDAAGSEYGNANVANYLASDFGTFGSNTVVTAGNVVASVVDTGAIVNEFPLGIQTGDGYVWQFAGNIFRSPEGGTWTSAANTEYISSNDDGFVVLNAYSSGNIASELFMEHGFVRVRVDNGGPAQDWNFRVSGVLDVPGDIIPQSNATQSLGNATNYWSNLWVANNTIFIGGVPLGVTGNTLTVNGEAVLSNDSDSSITTTGNLAAGNILTDNLFYANGEPFMSGSTGNITFTNTTMSPPDGEDLFITAANSEVEITGLDFRVEVTDDVRIQGNNVVSIRNTSDVDPITIITDYNDAEHVWRFGEDGSFEIPGDTTVAGDITGTSGASTLVLAAEPDSNTAIQLNNIVDSTISTVANLEIRTDVSNSARTWTFDTTGNLTAPGNVAVTGDIDANNYVYFRGGTLIGDETDGNIFRITSPLGYGVVIEADADIEGSNWQWTFDNTGTLGLPDKGSLYPSADDNAGLILLDTDSGNRAQLSAIGNVQLRSDSANSGYEWVFDTNGVLTAPGNISATNFIVSESLIGSDASPQPTISGFSTISATGNITGANIITAGRVLASGNILGLNFGTEGSVQASSVEATGNITGADLIITGNVVGNVSGFAIGYRDIPQVSFTGNATMAAADAGKHFYSTQSTDYVLTIADNSAVSWPVGTAITVVNRGTGNITVAQAAGVSLYLAGNSSAGNRTVTTYGMATVLNVAANVWMINGTGVG